MLRATSLRPALGVVALVAAGGLALWRASTRAARRERSQERTFLVDYEATVRGVLPLSEVREAWRSRLGSARARFGEDDVRTLVVRIRLMTFDELADDVDAAAEQIDAVLARVATLDEQARWLFVAGLHWLTWRTRRKNAPDRCRPAFEHIVAASNLDLEERVALGVRLARAATQGNRILEARWILERASKAIAKGEVTTEASPYRSQPAADTGPDPNVLGFEVMCERVWIETSANEVTGGRTALAELDQWLCGLPNASDLLVARARYWRGMVGRTAGELAQAERDFAGTADAFAAIKDKDEEGVTHALMNLIAWVDTLLDLYRPGEAATVSRRAQQAARTAAEHAQTTAGLASALVQLGQDEEAEAQLAGLPLVGEDAVATVVPTRALLALRGGDTHGALRLTRRALAASDRGSPLATTGWLTLGRVLVASGRPRLAGRAVAGAAATVIAAVGPAHPRLAPLYRFLSERRRAAGQSHAAATLDEAADHLFALASK